MRYFRISGLDEGVGLRRFQTAAAAVICLIQGGFSLVFLYLAHALGKPLLQYMQKRNSSVNNYHVQVMEQLSGVIMALVMNGVFLILNVGTTLFYVVLMEWRDIPVAFAMVYLGLVPVLRLGLFYWQVLLLSSFPFFFLDFLFSFRAWCLFFVKQLKIDFFPNHRFSLCFQVKLMRPRQQGSKNLLKWAACYQILCDWKRLYTVFPDDHVVNQPEQEPAVINISSSLWDTSTITSTSPAEKYDYSITFPSLALYGSSAAT
jgi:hypothetical protein